jgi:hypothetical protein
MSGKQSITFNDAIEIVESFPEEQMESLVEIVKKHLIEKRRDNLARNIRKAKNEYAAGEIKRGTVDDLMREMSK